MLFADEQTPFARAKKRGGCGITGWITGTYGYSIRSAPPPSPPAAKVGPSFNGLIPGTEYTIQIRALGGSTGHSDWSDITKHRSL